MSLPEDKYKPEVPNNYFGQFGKKIVDMLEEEELFHEKDYPVIFSLDKQDGLTTPVNYLKDFNPNLKSRKSKLNRNLKVLVLAVITIMAVSTFALSGKKKTPIEEELNADEILQYFAEEDELFDSYYENELEYFFDEENEDRFADLEEEILIEYLDENADQYDLALLY